jgi:hypothetical protein
MSTRPPFTYRLEIERTGDGARFPARPVPDAFLQPAREQVFFVSRRRGFSGDGDPIVRESPVAVAGGAGQIQGVTMAAGDGDTYSELTFGLELFGAAASMEAVQLVQRGHLQADDKFAYRVYAEPAEPSPVRDSMAGVVARVRRNPLTLLDGTLADWLDDAHPIGPIQDADHPLLITERALAAAQEYCRKPVDREGGALLLGHLYRQREPQLEIFGVIDDAIEAKYAEQQLFRLDLKTEGFAYLNTQLHLRRTRLGRQHELALGFAHAHNFLPSVREDGKAQCTTCPDRTACKLTSSFYSQDDTQFHRALFGRAPYAVGLVWGFTPQLETELRVFCLDGGQPRQRGFYRLHDTANHPAHTRRTADAVG